MPGCSAAARRRAARTWPSGDRSSRQMMEPSSRGVSLWLACCAQTRPRRSAAAPQRKSGAPTTVAYLHHDGGADYGQYDASGADFLRLLDRRQRWPRRLQCDCRNVSLHGAASITAGCASHLGICRRLSSHGWRVLVVLVTVAGRRSTGGMCVSCVCVSGEGHCRGVEAHLAAPPRRASQAGSDAAVMGSPVSSSLDAQLLESDAASEPNSKPSSESLCAASSLAASPPGGGAAAFCSGSGNGGSAAASAAAATSGAQPAGSAAAATTAAAGVLSPPPLAAASSIVAHAPASTAVTNVLGRDRCLLRRGCLPYAAAAAKCAHHVCRSACRRSIGVSVENVAHFSQPPDPQHSLQACIRTACPAACAWGRRARTARGRASAVPAARAGAQALARQHG
jgi:hypothetical protein